MLREDVSSSPPLATGHWHCPKQLLPFLFVVTSLILPVFGRAQTFSSLADLDTFVSGSYDALSNSACIYPEGPYTFGIECGMATFADGSDIAVLTNAFTATTVFGVPAYPITVIETQADTRVWLYLGANGVPFHTNAVPAGFDQQAWVRAAYRSDPPAYLTDTNLAQWYTDRDRSRLYLTLTLVNANDWGTLLAAQQAAATNCPLPGVPSPCLPADTNSLAFAGIAGAGNNAFSAWLYAPSSRPVALLKKTNLLDSAWSYAGDSSATPAFTLWNTPAGDPSACFRVGYLDVDSDGDGVPDFIEIYVTHTDPYTWDSAGTSLGDYERYFIYGLSATNRDSNGDGMDDDEAILAGRDPNVWNTSAGTASIRYYYDADDRVSGTFSGSPAGAVRYRISPAGNVASTAERSTP